MLARIVRDKTHHVDQIPDELIVGREVGIANSSDNG